jgi:hypothetical protein
VQGTLRREELSVDVETGCAHCGLPIRFRAGSDGRYDARGDCSGLLVFEPSIDWTRFREPNIIDAY